MGGRSAISDRPTSNKGLHFFEFYIVAFIDSRIPYFFFLLRLGCFTKSMRSILSGRIKLLFYLLGGFVNGNYQLKNELVGKINREAN